METKALIALLSDALGAIAVVMLLGLNQRFRHPQLTFRHPRREGLTALLILLGCLGLGWFLLPHSVSLTWVPQSQALLNQRLRLALLSLLPFGLLLILNRQPLRSVRLGKAWLMPGLQMGLALIFLSLFLRGKFMALFSGLSAEQVNGLFLWLGLCLTEETVQRGYVQARLEAWLGVRNGWLLTSLLSVAWQLPIWLPAVSGQRLLLFAGISFFQALILGWMARRTHHIVAPALWRTVSSWLWMV
jgi:membrane protease YdiL (CAAX protease family)